MKKLFLLLAASVLTIFSAKAETNVAASDTVNVNGFEFAVDVTYKPSIQFYSVSAELLGAEALPALPLENITFEFQLPGDTTWHSYTVAKLVEKGLVTVNGTVVTATLPSTVSPALFPTAGVVYFRFRLNYLSMNIVSDIYHLAIGFNTVSVSNGDVTITLFEGTPAYDAATNTLVLGDVAVEGVPVAINNESEELTLVVSGGTLKADEVGIESTKSMTITSGGVEGDALTVVAAMPLHATPDGIAILTLDSAFINLVVTGHEGDLTPGEAALRRSLSPAERARYEAHRALQAANDESVISGFDEVDFINCGVIAPEGAEYDEENMSLMLEGEPVYNCTIAPAPAMPQGVERVESVSTVKAVRNGQVYILRQGRTYSAMGQQVR